MVNKRIINKSGVIKRYKVLGRSIYKPLSVTGLAGGGTKTGALDNTSFAILDGTSGIVAATITKPLPGWLLMIYCPNASSAVTVTLGSGTTWNGTNRVATLGTGKALLVFGVSRTRFMILENIGTVTFSG